MSIETHKAISWDFDETQKNLAPQMHEIAPILVGCDLYQFKTGFELGYTKLSGEYIHFNENTHFAEMYAKMYIELKKINEI